MSKKMILGIGNPLLDISAETDASLLEKYGLSPANAILAEESHIPLYKELVDNFDVTYIAGGATQNSIRAAQWMLSSAAPGSTRYIGCVGDDDFAKVLRDEATKDGVEVAYLVDKDTPTGTCACLITDKDRSLVANLSAANNYKKEHLEENFRLVEEASVVYSAGFFLTVSPESLLAIGEHTAKTGKTFMFNLAAPFLIKFFWDGKMEKVLPYTDIVFGNETEASTLGEERGWGPDLKEIAKQLSLFETAPEKGDAKRLVVFTQGSEAVITARNGEVTVYDGPTKVADEEIVDLNGAGDCFVGGYLAATLQGKDAPEAIKAGHYCAGVCIRISGTNFTGKTPEFDV